MGDLLGTIYDFPEKDDILPMHDHTELDIHITIVAKGSFLAKGVDWQTTLNNGNVVDWQPHQPHEFIALEPNSRIVNIQKNVGVRTK
jgi:hypothetical protein